MASPGKKRRTDEKLRDRETVARLYLEGWSQQAIADRLGYTQQQVSYDLGKVREGWVEKALESFDEAKARELAKVDQLEAEYWRAWHRSVGEHVVQTEKEKNSAKDGPATEVQQRKEELVGDPRFLHGVERCIETRMRILHFAEIDRRVRELVRTDQEDKKKRRRW